MANETQAASSPAEEVDVFGGQTPTVAEFDHYRRTNELPERFKPAEATTDAPEETVAPPEGDEPETDPDSDPEEVQEPPQKVPPAEKRIKQLLAEKKELQRRLDESAKPAVKPEQQTQPAQQYTRQAPTPEDKDDKGNPKYATYEDYVDARADWRAEQRIAQYKQEMAQGEALKALKVKLDESRSRYQDADQVIFPTAHAIGSSAQIPPAIKEIFAQSDVFTDLCYVVGSDPEELHKFVTLAQNDPRAALAKVFEYERGIREELAKAGKEVEGISGKAPEKRQTSAPKPPAPVTGGSSRSFDVSDESLSADEWARKRNAQVAKRG